MQKHLSGAWGLPAMLLPSAPQSRGFSVEESLFSAGCSSDHKTHHLATGSTTAPHPTAPHPTESRPLES